VQQAEDMRDAAHRGFQVGRALRAAAVCVRRSLSPAPQLSPPSSVSDDLDWTSI
jgi:hypothetical protein